MEFGRFLDIFVWSRVLICGGVDLRERLDFWIRFFGWTEGRFVRCVGYVDGKFGLDFVVF